MSNEKVYAMKFADVYPLLVNKAVRKGRTKEEVDQVISWLTGYTLAAIDKAASSEIAYGAFFQSAPQMNENRALITGSVCGVKLNDIGEPLMRDIRYLDKLVDELAKGRPMEKILRK